jgi:phosphocarrier protein HPr
MVSQTFTVINPHGLHARPIKLFVETATTEFPGCEFHLTKGKKKVNGKSMLGMLTLGAKNGDEILLEVTGDNEAEGLEKLGQVIEKIFEE